MRLFLIAATLLVSTAATAADSSALSDSSEQKTPAAVIAVDNAWGEAETRGDVQFVSRLLLPEYRSIGSDGRTHDRSAILASTLKRGATANAASAVAAYRAEHPTSPQVTIIGDTAILRWVSTRAETADLVTSFDLFIYREGHWHAAYSQHTTAGA